MYRFNPTAKDESVTPSNVTDNELEVPVLAASFTTK